MRVLFRSRVARFVGLDPRFGQIGALYVGPGVAIEADGAHVEEGRLAGAARIIRCLFRPGVSRNEIGAVAFYIVQPRPALELRLDPRSEERRVGKECVRPCRYRGWPY